MITVHEHSAKANREVIKSNKLNIFFFIATPLTLS